MGLIHIDSAPQRDWSHIPLNTGWPTSPPSEEDFYWPKGSKRMPQEGGHSFYPGQRYNPDLLFLTHLYQQELCLTFRTYHDLTVEI